MLKEVLKKYTILGRRNIMFGLLLFNSFYGIYFSLIVIRVGFAFLFLLLSLYLFKKIDFLA